MPFGISSRTLGPAINPNSLRAPSAGVPCLGEMHDDTMPRQALQTLVRAPHRARLYPPLPCLELATARLLAEWRIAAAWICHAMLHSTADELSLRVGRSI